MKNNIYTILLLILIFSCSHSVYSQGTFPSWEVGEELTYKVKWTFIRLGTIKLHICDTVRINNQKAFHIKCYIDSNPALFFVNYHTVAETFFSKDLEVQYFTYIEEDEGITYKAEYRLNHVRGLVSIELTDTSDTSHKITKEIPFTGNLQDGTSLIYYARAHADKSEQHRVTYLADDGQDVVLINFKGKDGLLKTKPFEQKIPAYYLEGHVYNRGMAGLSGNFKGWFSADSKRLPLMAKMKVFIGSVSLKLEEYKINKK